VKILILKPSSLGDVVHSLPVLRLLKRHLPQSAIYWWIESALAPLLEDDPDLSGLIRFERRVWAAPRNWVRLVRSIAWMRSQQFDWVIDLQSLARSAAVAWLANGKLLLGLDDSREGARGYYDIVVRRPSFTTHAVDWYLRVLEPLGVPANESFEWLPPRREAAESVRRKWPIANRVWVLLQPGARWLNKRWPVEFYSDLLLRLANCRADLQFAILGGAEDRDLGKTLAAAAPARCLDLTGQLSLPEMVEWIRLGQIMVSNDTGPMHVATALGKPVVALFGPTEPRRTGPYRQLQHVLQLQLPCVPCLRSTCSFSKPLECLRALSPERVCDVVRKRLAELSL
jgi:lipopolysaccharide heptosyltransferase I